ncbi:hypothetical protein [Micromonospora sp. NPDC049645]|uniref:hypothetical protein n=1 Tax=Micromonospora sp. NPDC049645 TaxID=3155508 RepID=UPI00342E9321
MTMKSGEPFWLLAVLGDREGSTPVVGIQPGRPEQHEQVAVRLRRVGFRPVTGRDWNMAVAPISPTSAVDVVRGDLVRITTGAASVYTDRPNPVTPQWISAARERRALVVLVPSGTYGDGEWVTEPGLDRLAVLAGRRELLAGLAAVRFDLPVQRPAGDRR